MRCWGNNTGLFLMLLVIRTVQSWRENKRWEIANSRYSTDNQKVEMIIPTFGEVPLKWLPEKN
jgi:hypothetical protein